LATVFLKDCLHFAGNCKCLRNPKNIQNSRCFRKLQMPQKTAEFVVYNRFGRNLNIYWEKPQYLKKNENILENRNQRNLIYKF
jgi:hypothetical protein